MLEDGLRASQCDVEEINVESFETLPLSFGLFSERLAHILLSDLMEAKALDLVGVEPVKEDLGAFDLHSLLERGQQLGVRGLLPEVQ